MNQTFASWASVIASAATVAAFLVLIAGLRQDRSDRRQSQASRVAAWHQVLDGDDSRFPRPYSQPRRFAVLIKNRSDLPVYEVELRRRLQSAADDLPVQYDIKKLAVVPPHGEIATGMSSERRQDDRIDATGVTFRDAAGRWWTRDFVGELRKGQRLPTDAAKRPGRDADAPA